MVFTPSEIRTFWLDLPQRIFTNTAATLGSFDGIHLGHEFLLKHLIATANAKELMPVLLTFDPHPRLVLSNNISVLTTIAERELLLRKSGLPYIVHIRFTREVANLSAEQFVERYIVESLDAKHVVIGYDHHFGKGRSGNPDEFVASGKKFGFSVDVLPPVMIDGRIVKSNAIRELILRGEISNANKMLGHPYLVLGQTAPGRGLGTHIGYSTANLQLSGQKLLPRDGVYAATASIMPDGKMKRAMVYIGRAPTFDLAERMFEVHIFDHDGSPLYGKNIATYLHEFVREDRYFKTVDELKKQIDSDAIRTREILSRVMQS